MPVEWTRVFCEFVAFFSFGGLSKPAILEQAEKKQNHKSNDSLLKTILNQHDLSDWQLIFINKRN